VVYKYKKPHRYKRKKSIFRNRFFWLGVLTPIIIGVIFYFLFLSETFQVKKIIVTGEEKVSTEDIKLFVGERLENKVLFFFQTRSIFSVNLDEIKKDILSNFLQLAEVEIGRKLPDTLNVMVVERFAAAIWCQARQNFLEENLGGQEEQCFLVDNEGIIFERTNGAKPELLKIRNLTLNQDLKLGERSVEKEKMEQIMKINSGLTNLNLKIIEAALITEKRLNLKTEEEWEIYFNLEKDLDWQIARLKQVLEEILEKKILPENGKNFQYIDLRFEKVYCK